MEQRLSQPGILDRLQMLVIVLVFNRVRRPDMCETDMECKVEILPFLDNSYHSAFQAGQAPLTRRGKLAAEAFICCQFSAAS